MAPVVFSYHSPASRIRVRRKESGGSAETPTLEGDTTATSDTYSALKLYKLYYLFIIRPLIYYLTYMSGDVGSLVPIKCIEGLLVLFKSSQILQLFPAVFFLFLTVLLHYFFLNSK